MEKKFGAPKSDNEEHASPDIESVLNNLMNGREEEIMTPDEIDADYLNNLKVIARRIGVDPEMENLNEFLLKTCPDDDTWYQWMADPNSAKP